MRRHRLAQPSRSDRICISCVDSKSTQVHTHTHTNERARRHLCSRQKLDALAMMMTRKAANEKWRINKYQRATAYILRAAAPDAITAHETKEETEGEREEQMFNETKSKCECAFSCGTTKTQKRPEAHNTETQHRNNNILCFSCVSFFAFFAHGTATMKTMVNCGR